MSQDAPNFSFQPSDLSLFLSRHAKPYDPATDDYERPPFADDVVSPGRSEFYNFHYYLTKVPPESIVGFIRHYTMPGDVVLDPFCGSGMTGVAIQMVNAAGSSEPRHCVLNDLSPAACHIAANYTAPVSADILRQEFQRLKQRLKEDEQLLYRTFHFEPAIGIYDPRAIAGLPLDLFGAEVNHGVTAAFECVPYEQVRDFIGDGSPDNPVGLWMKIPARLLYVVWSDVYKCEGFKSTEMPTGRINPRTNKPILRKARSLRGCGQEIIARGANDKQADDGNNAFIRCPHCGERWMKGRIRRLGVVPVEECYEYSGLVQTRAGLTTKTLRNLRAVTTDQKKFLAALTDKPIPVDYPNPPLDKSNPRYRRDSLAGKGIETYAQFFTKRNMWAMAVIWNEIQRAPDAVQSALRFCFTSQVMRCSRLRRMKGEKLGEQLSGTLHIASETAETHVGSNSSRTPPVWCWRATRTVC